MDYHYLEAIKQISPEAYAYIAALPEEEEKGKIHYREGGKTLIEAFNWNASPQGFVFWIGVNNGVDKLGKTHIGTSLARIIRKIHHFFCAASASEAYCKTPIFGFTFDYIDLGADDKTRISVMRRGWDHPPTAEERREKGLFLKPGKLLAALFPSLPPAEISLLADKLASALRFSQDFTFSGFQISPTPSEIYTMDHHGISSCMIGAGRERFAMYDQIPCCKILYKKDDSGCIIGRALIWDHVEADDLGTSPITLMDRVYYNNDDTLQEFLKYAAVNGWYRKQKQCIDGWDIVAPNGDIAKDVKISIELEIELDLEECPYVDTFFIELENGKLSNQYPIWPKKVKTEFRSTEGDDSAGIYSSESRCANCERHMNEDALHYIDNDPYCEECRDELFRYVSCCGEYVRNAVWSEEENRHLCRACFDHSYFTCTHCGAVFHIDYAVVSVGGGDYCLRCAETQFEQCAGCEEWHESGVLQEIEADLYCNDCAEMQLEQCAGCECREEEIKGAA